MAVAPKAGPYTDREIIVEDFAILLAMNLAGKMQQIGDPDWKDQFVKLFQEAADVADIQSREHFTRLTDRMVEMSSYMDDLQAIMPGDFAGQSRMLKLKFRQDRERGKRS